jgi:hypothetical protein
MILVNGMKKPTSKNYLIYERENRKWAKRACFPISNWTGRCLGYEQEQIEIPSIYFSHKRKVFLRRNDLVTLSYVYQEENEEIEGAFV